LARDISYLFFFAAIPGRSCPVFSGDVCGGFASTVGFKQRKYLSPRSPRPPR
jgi:hypothetical protein